MDILISQGKIVLGFYQVIGELFTSLHDVNWTKTLKYIGDIISIIELNIFQLFVRPQCFNEKLQINPKVEFVIAMTYLAIMVFVPFVIYHMLKITYFRFKARFSYDSHINYVERIKSNIITVVIISLFLTYPPICTIIFQIYPKACEKFCLDVNNNTCKVLLRSDYELECKDLNVYHTFAYFATAGYIVAYPTVLFFVLRAQVKRSPSQREGENTYRSINENDGDVISMNEASCNGPNAIWIDFLCENYKSQFWYWEILELTRKVLQTALITLLGWKDRLTVLATIGVSVLFLTLHARYMPMKRSFEQKLQMFSLVAVLVNVVVAAMDVPDDYGNAMSVALIFLNAVVLVIIAGELFFGLFFRIKQAKLHTPILRFGTTYISSFLVCFSKLCRRNN
ncbi:hypothetical protein HOLleu_02217 [Holothuria leucospilota]|uniref:Uncharacterized protein n=1 Tax=Holothuria leucospilota TaxID=206669 RepID=A0A9Q1CPC1_HOLLE|nr:hypothetical protein HOLleu_02217 [Holothuria leucospilota]